MDHRTCSTLRRVEPHATHVGDGNTQSFPILQYPQTGRTSCNNTILYFHGHPKTCLQYPQTGRTSCNLAKSSWRRKKRRSCSTLRRVEPHATFLTCPYAVAVKSLQYPQTGRTSCNSSPAHLQPSSLDLQYPQTGRTSCNPRCRCAG